VGAAVAPLSITTAHAQSGGTTASVRSFDIKAQPLVDAMREFSRATGIQVVYTASVGSGVTSGGVTGSLSAGEALSRLLTSTGLTFRFTGANAVTLEPAPQAADGAVQLGPVRVEGDGATGVARGSDPAASEGSRSYTVRSATTALKLPVSLRETPQSVTVVTQQQIQDKAYVTLDQAIRETPGLVMLKGNGDSRFEYYSRGRDITNIQYDGLSNPVTLYARDVDGLDELDMYDRIEVIRGATGLTTGAGNPSGAINLIRKRPLEGNLTSFSTRVSSFDNVRATIDLSRSLNAEGTLRARVVGSYGTGETFRDYQHNSGGLFYGTIEADLGDNTVVNLGYSYQKLKSKGYDFGGLPSRRDGSFFDFDTSDLVGLDWAYLDRRQHTGFIDVTHELGNGWSIQATGRGSWAKSEMLGSYSWYAVSNLNLFDRFYDYDNGVYAGDVHASGPVTLFGRTHELVVGINGAKTELTVGSYLGGSRAVLDPENWDASSVARNTNHPYWATLAFKTKQIGTYAALRLSLADPLKLILGGRLSWYNSSSDSGYGPSTIKKNAHPIPYVGLVYDVTRNISAYASYTSTFEPQSAYGIDGNQLDPISGKNYEIGLKGEFLDQKLNASVALFQNYRDNVAQQLTGLTYCNPAVLACYEGIDGVRSRGVDLELAGAFTDRWNVTGGYTYAVQEETKGANAGKKFNTAFYPEHLLKLFSSYTFVGDQLTLGAGVTWQSKLYYQTATASFRQPAYAVVDLMGTYRFDDKASVQLNVTNLLDKEYYTSPGVQVNYGRFFGTPRELRATFKYAF
jgi:outer membrane receptor for ferric coprogen and ferric-rhodotorulic acid